MAGHAAAQQQSGGFTYSSNSNAITITGYTGAGGAVTIPDTIAGRPVRTISGAFKGKTTVTSVSIPDGVTSIGASAFEGCTRMTSVIIPDSVTSIGNEAFQHCGALTGVTLSRSLTFIGHQAFENCITLTSVVIPDSVTSIGRQAFHHCTALTSVTLSRSLTSIGNQIFEGCTVLTSVTIPESVTSIGEQAFEDCPALASVTIRGSVTSIGREAFQDCTALTSITFEGNAPGTVGLYVFRRAAPGLTIFHYEGATGFTQPNWQGRPTVALPRQPVSGGEVAVDSITLQAGGVSVVVTGSAGWRYTLQRSPDLGSASWSPVLTRGPMTAPGPVELTDAAAPAGQAFYRVVAVGP